MSEEPTRQSMFLPVFGLVLLTLPVLLTVRWIVMSTGEWANHPELVAEFVSIFPPSLRDARMLTWIQIIFSGTASAVGYVGVQKLAGGKRLLCIFVAFIGGFLTLWMLFTLM